mgnify:CR=1 FL=1
MYNELVKKGVLLLTCESTNVEKEGYSMSEKKVAQSILDIARKINGRMIVATFASNVHRVEQIISSAVACDRKICIFGRSMETVVSIARKHGSIKTI